MKKNVKMYNADELDKLLNTKKEKDRLAELLN